MNQQKRTGTILFLLLAFGLCNCEGFGCSSAVIAELTSTSGTVERDYAVKINAWEKTSVSATFVTNDGIRTRKDATAQLTLIEGSLVVMQPSTQLRFARTEPGPNRVGVRVESGSAQVEAQSNELQIETGIGLAMLNKGSTLTLEKRDDQLAVQLDIGTAKFVMADGQAVTLDAGNEIVLSIGSAQLVSSGPTDAPNSTTEDTETTDDLSFDEETEQDVEIEDERDQPKGQGIPDDRGTAEKADFAITAGESAFVYAMHTPVAVEIQFGDLCSGQGHVRISRKKIWGTGTGSVILNLPSKGYAYEVHCIENGEMGRTQKHGRLTILKDRGKSHLSLSAPVSNVDADGRDYNVLYQSKLPQVIISWPDAPSSSGFKLHLTGPSGTKTISSTKNQVRFASGEIEEGSYKFKFTATGQSKRSRTSSLNIRFDNATPKAILKTPANHSFASGAAVEVSGIALPGWTASVYGSRLPMDAQNRFSGTAQHRSNYSSLAVKLTHAKRGTHYFLRQAN